MGRKLLYLLISVSLFYSCNPNNDANKLSPVISKEAQIKINLDSLKRVATTGDLIARLGDDILSYQIKLLNDSDKSYSHAGIIIERNNQKFVAHIAPDENNGDTIKYIPIDEFLDTTKNVKCALYRYDLSSAERDSMTNIIEEYKKKNVHFDWLYNLSTDDKLYCSEMISKALKASTHNRIICGQTSAPSNMIPLLTTYFKGKLSREEIIQRKIITIDNLYHIPHCTSIMEFRLKYFPGE